MATYRTKDNDVLDAICWQYYGDRKGTVEAVLRANPKLSFQPDVLPSGIVITLPELPHVSEKKSVSLWD